jgi:CubicO group peptidase (beta-lactamase class C family)
MDSNASEPTIPNAVPSLFARHELTAQDFSAFTRRIMNEQLGRFGIPGAVVVAIKDGGVLLSQGYGFADLEQHKPMTADTTFGECRVDNQALLGYWRHAAGRERETGS